VQQAQGFGVMAGEVLRMNIIAKFELRCFVSTVVLKCRHYAKPRTVGTKLRAIFTIKSCFKVENKKS